MRWILSVYRYELLRNSLLYLYSYMQTIKLIN